MGPILTEDAVGFAVFQLEGLHVILLLVLGRLEISLFTAANVIVLLPVCPEIFSTLGFIFELSFTLKFR